MESGSDLDRARVGREFRISSLEEPGLAVSESHAETFGAGSNSNHSGRERQRASESGEHSCWIADALDIRSGDGGSEFQSDHSAGRQHARDGSWKSASVESVCTFHFRSRDSELVESRCSQFSVECRSSDCFARPCRNCRESKRSADATGGK